MSYTRLLLLATLLFCSSCQSVMMVAALPFVAYEQMKSGSVDSHHERWGSIEKDGVYFVKEKLKANYANVSSSSYSWRAFPDDNSGVGVPKKIIRLNEGSFIRIVDLIYVSDGFNYSKYDYIGRIESGDYAGELIRVNALLVFSEDGVRVDPRYLEKK